MREILFRGKRLDNGQWVYGYYAYDRGKYHYIKSVDDSFNYRVDPDTVGQYTGVVDKNGKQVFEGDIIGYTDASTGKTKIFGVVKWYHEGNFYINTDSYCNYTSDMGCTNIGYMLNRAATQLHVIGNKWDNF